MTKKDSISVIIPVFNELERLDNLRLIHKFLDRKKYDYELIVVDDGGKRENLKYLKKLKKEISFELISYRQNKGKGYAVKQGVLKAKGDYILFTDIDLSVPIKEISKFIKIAKLSPVVIGSRNIKGSKVLVSQSKTREFMGQIFTNLSQFVLDLRVSDFTCGFKCFQKDAGKEIFKRSVINRWGFDSEILLIAKRLNYKITELPVEWSHNKQTKVSFPKDIIRSFAELMRIKNNDLRGHYLKAHDKFTS